MFLEDKKRRYEVAGRLRGKVTKEEANYRPHDSAETTDTCFECKHYMSREDAAGCKKVAGIVYAEDTCDLWASRGKEEPKEASKEVSKDEIKEEVSKQASIQINIKIARS